MTNTLLDNKVIMQEVIKIQFLLNEQSMYNTTSLNGKKSRIVSSESFFT